MMSATIGQAGVDRLLVWMLRGVCHGLHFDSGDPIARWQPPFAGTGDVESEQFIRGMIAACDSERAFKALSAQLHSCRAGGWLTAGDAVSQDAHADAVRACTWRFFSELLEAAQAKLRTHREAWAKLHENCQTDTESPQNSERETRQSNTLGGRRRNATLLRKRRVC